MNDKAKTIMRNEYADENVLVTGDLTRVFGGGSEKKPKVPSLVYCHEGEVSIGLNNQQFRIGKNDVLICLPYMIVGNVEASARYDVTIVSVISRDIKWVNRIKRDTWLGLDYMRKHPVQHCNEAEQEAMSHYIGLINGMTRSGEIPEFERGTLFLLVQAYFRQALMYVCREIDMNALEGGEGDTRRQNLIFKSFIECLAADGGCHRSVSYYAERLCYTPKYLSAVVKRVSGKCPLGIINKAAMSNICAAIMQSDKEIKQIANDFLFPNCSFFAKYFRKHMGMTPTEYREAKVKQQ